MKDESELARSSREERVEEESCLAVFDEISSAVNLFSMVIQQTRGLFNIENMEQ